jgi:SP family general alpha glucoside:H+ symporter-like MFS transporter
MEVEKIIPTENGLQGFDLSDPATIELIHHAQEGDAADRLLTIRQALKKYKKAVFWGLFLSTSLIMEGYDVVMVSVKLPTLAFKSIDGAPETLLTT